MPLLVFFEGLQSTSIVVSEVDCMNYQVLARKWRPKTFKTMVGQTHVLKALVNALDNDRLHHAYLFTGTRGVGKTTIARIFAKSLNCEKGVTSEPCGVCSACTEIDEGRFIDLIEVDAASRTKVEDTRELLDNVQYTPTRGRYKVYLIDEVHMLSGHSFNALLKTLEEPPAHVKFLLATTDPQKLPITVLSRCLQFSLKAMTPDKIVGHLQHVLEAEAVGFDEAALWALARAADGSMRDAMSLADQAIAFGNGTLNESDVQTMLGTIDREFVYGLVDALASGSGPTLLDVIASMSEQSPDYAGALADLISMLHRIAVAQIAPETITHQEGDSQRILAFAGLFTAEDIQLYYQMALLGRKDLPLSPDPRSGFEMTMLRMMLFRPEGILPPNGTEGGGRRTTSDHQQGSTGSAITSSEQTQQNSPSMVQQHMQQARAALSSEQAPSNVVDLAAHKEQVKAVPVKVAIVDQKSNAAPQAQVKLAAPQANVALKPVEHVEQKSYATGNAWAELLQQLDVNGSVLNFARNCALERQDGDTWHLSLSPKHETLYQSHHIEDLEVALSGASSKAISLKLMIQQPTVATPDELAFSFRAEQMKRAEATLRSDPFVKQLFTTFNAVLDQDSIQPLND